MDIPALLLALILPGALGAAWIGLLVPGSTAGRVPLVLGNGLMLGLVLIPLLMRIIDATGLPLGFPGISSFAMLLTVAAIALHFVRRPKLPTPPVAFPPRAVAQKWLFAFFFLMIALHLVTVGLELLGRPLFPWDATMHWATKARVWFEAGRIVPFVANEQWLALGGEGVFTDHHANYPITTPLLQVWICVALGRWDESLMNLPWLLCLIALGTAFYGQARAAGVGVTVAIVFTYMLMSLPLLNTHVALAGYADLFLGACYCAALMALHNWSGSRQAGQLVIALGFALCCTLIKNEGFYWLLTFVPAFVVVLFPDRRAVLLLAILLLALMILMAVFPRDIPVAGHSMNVLKLHFRPEALAAIVNSFGLHGNWHLLGYLTLGLIPLAVVLPGFNLGAHRGIITALASAFVLLLVLFTFTRYASAAIRFTAVGRTSLQLVPGLLFLLALIANRAVAYCEAE